jgi:hypothetical protein
LLQNHDPASRTPAVNQNRRLLVPVAVNHDRTPAAGGVCHPAIDADSLLAGVWPVVLVRIATDGLADVMYDFLRRMPKAMLVSPLPLPPPQRRSAGHGLKRTLAWSQSGDDGAIQ